MRSRLALSLVSGLVASVLSFAACSDSPSDPAPFEGTKGGSSSGGVGADASIKDGGRNTAPPSTSRGSVEISLSGESIRLDRNGRAQLHTVPNDFHVYAEGGATSDVTLGFKDTFVGPRASCVVLYKDDLGDSYMTLFDRGDTCTANVTATGNVGATIHGTISARVSAPLLDGGYGPTRQLTGTFDVPRIANK